MKIVCDRRERTHRKRCTHADTEGALKRGTQEAMRKEGRNDREKGAGVRRGGGRGVAVGGP